MEEKEGMDGRSINEPVYQQPEDYPKGKPARMIYDEYGIWLKRVRVRDIDPTEPKIRESLQEVLKARTDAAATAEKAKGTRDKDILEGIGQASKELKVGKAQAEVILAKFRAKGTGLNSIGKKLGFNAEDNKLLASVEMAIELASKSDYVYMTGDPANVGNWALAAVDRFKSGAAKIASGTNGEAKVGLEEIKTAVEGMPGGDIDKLLEHLKGKKGGEIENEQDEQKNDNKKE